MMDAPDLLWQFREVEQTSTYQLVTHLWVLSQSSILRLEAVDQLDALQPMVVEMVCS